MGKLLSPPGTDTAHVCIDMQNLFAPGAPWATPWIERVTPLTAALVEHAPARTVFTRFIPPLNKEEPRGVWKAYYEKWECVTRERLEPHMIELIPALGRFVPPAAVIDRQTYCAFGNGRLHAFLDQHHVDTLIISGGETDVCVLATVLAAVDGGYRVILAEDALCSSSDQSHEALTNLYRQRFDIQIEVTTTADILGCWRN
jgi:nicotinamidase-related amidase